MSSPARNDYHGSTPSSTNDPNPPTVASFSPVTLSQTHSTNKQRSTILVHQKSPLLIATPPQITRALAYSHPFLLPLNKLAGLLTWTTGDPWESFLLLAVFWGVVLYGDAILRWAGPLVVVFGLIIGMYSRRYSPLSSTGWTGEQTAKAKKAHRKSSGFVDSAESPSTKHQKTLDEIVETLKIFTSRCNLLLEPLLQLTDFLSTQRTATTATTRPALTTLFIRIILITPGWILLTLPWINVITTKRIVLASGTLFLTWHSRPNRISRTILWRSALIRRLCSAITGLQFSGNIPPTDTRPPLPPRGMSKSTTGSSYTLSTQSEKASTLASASRRADSTGVRFTFILYENQRRWVGLGWTTSLFAYERAAWTDEHLNAAPSKDEFELPSVEGQNVRWRWVAGSDWKVEGAGENDEGGAKGKEGADGGMGWIYYDNKWQNGRRGQDGWGRYTRRRKWHRDAELVELTPSTMPTPTPSRSSSPTPSSSRSAAPSFNPNNNPKMNQFGDSNNDSPDDPPPSYASQDYGEKEPRDTDTASLNSTSSSKKGFFGRKAGAVKGEVKRKARRLSQTASLKSVEEAEDTGQEVRGKNEGWGVGDDARMGLE